MGQKTNPTALRLEKTNQHYKACWYSDRFYPEQLHNNYKTCTYITKVFHKIKRINPLVYLKLGYQLNQIFCIIPKKKQKRFKFFKKPKKEQVKNHLAYVTKIKNLNSYSSTFYGLVALTHTERQLPSQNKGYTFSNLINGQSWPRRGAARVATLSKGSHLANPTFVKANLCRQNLSPLVRTLFYRKSLHSLLRDNNLSRFENKVKFDLKLKKTLNRDRRSRFSRYIGNNKPMLPLQLLKEKVDKNQPYLSHSQRNHENRLLWTKQNCKLTKDKAVTLPANTAPAPFFVRNLTLPRKLSLEKKVYYDFFDKSLYPGTQSLSRKTFIYPIKATFTQQSSHFLAQRISNALKNRVTFQRLRRQILWDISKSKYVKGLRVTLSGRVESKSKKAQKARVRTFQWGQTELHVLSALVQFTSQDLVTPFGKIGIKVWICYGN